jgi:peptidyl-prolyl cis-trans isomerase B (cyclophilin B)
MKHGWLFAVTLIMVTGCTTNGMNASIETTKGTIEVELYEESKPRTVGNFVDYAEDGFYDGTIFHRIVPGFVIQGGGFTEDGDKKETNPPIQYEPNTNRSNEVGTLAMARTQDPDSATSQFFINTADNSNLDGTAEQPGYAVFGKVTSGMDVVEEIANTSTIQLGGHMNWPAEKVVIESVTIN